MCNFDKAVEISGHANMIGQDIKGSKSEVANFSFAACCSDITVYVNVTESSVFNLQSKSLENPHTSIQRTIKKLPLKLELLNII